MATRKLTRIKIGDIRPIYAAVTAQRGTLTISGQPTCTIYKASFNGQYDTSSIVVASSNVTGFNPSAVNPITVWKSIDPTALGLTPGYYVVVFNFFAVDAANLSKRYTPGKLFAVDPVQTAN